MARRPQEQDSMEFESEGPPDSPAGPSLLDWARLVVGAVRRRWKIALAVFLLGLAGSVGFLQTRHPVYRVETRILAQRQSMLPSVVKPTVTDDSPTRAAFELVHRRENVVAIARAVQLVDTPAPGDVSERSVPGGEEGPFDLMVRRLDAALRVEVEEGTITIGVDWSDPVQAFRIAETALQNFLEARHVQEITAIDEVISVLRGRVTVLRANLDRTIAEVALEYGHDPVSVPVARTPAAGAVLGSEELVRLKSMLDAKERAIKDIEEYRRKKLVELQGQLDEKRGIYSDAHPVVTGLKQEIAARADESPQVAGLREEEKQLRRQYQARRAAEQPQGAAAPAPLRPSRKLQTAAVDDDERVRQARAEYQTLVGRVSAAEVDLEAARTAFKYRYTVIWPAEIPRKPFSPKPVKILGVGAAASLLLALAVATLLELARGRVLETWQVEKGLGLPLLARVSRKD
jgi:uncharacterized protein involved in exopolysaccharide biosynthesis